MNCLGEREFTYLLPNFGLSWLSSTRNRSTPANGDPHRGEGENSPRLEVLRGRQSYPIP
ncbi:hypothetical protein A2U01_0050404, partial [Trifolium medium]|nr:hypothetical protein [Trifolium medium]